MSIFSVAAFRVANLLGITAKGQATAANSLPVVLASDQIVNIGTVAKNALVFSVEKNLIEDLLPRPLPGSPTAQRSSITIQNAHASANLYLSVADDMTPGNGYKLIPGAAITLEASDTTILYGISDASGNAMDVRMIERV